MAGGRKNNAGHQPLATDNGLHKSRNIQPTQRAAEFAVHNFINFATAFVDGGDDQILKHFYVAGSFGITDFARKHLPSAAEAGTRGV